MSETQVKVDVAEVEPTQDELRKMAAKQLMAELFMLSRQVHRGAMNSVLVVQVKQVLRQLIGKYRNAGAFDEHDDVTAVFHHKQGRVEFNPTQGLKDLMTEISNELAREAVERDKQERALKPKDDVDRVETV